jgi:trimethylamine--corrinoid protein Co-methyltransferase
MEADLTVSYEKLVLDNEILGMSQRVLRGIEVNDDTLAVDLILEKGPGRDYLGEEHTIRHMRKEFFVPTLANRDPREQCKPQDTATARAWAFVREVQDAPPEQCLATDVQDTILRRFPEIVSSDRLEEREPAMDVGT